MTKEEFKKKYHRKTIGISDPNDVSLLGSHITSFQEICDNLELKYVHVASINRVLTFVITDEKEKCEDSLEAKSVIPYSDFLLDYKTIEENARNERA